MTLSSHARAEVLAGAIALGEATDAERIEYRHHLAACERCLQGLGGEIELERTANAIASARESEVWAPSSSGVLDRQIAARRRRTVFASVASALGIVLALGLYAEIPRVARERVVAQLSAAPKVAIARASVDRHPAALKAIFQPPRKMVVVHNVVQLYRAQVAAPVRAIAPSRGAPRRPADRPRQIADIVVHAALSPRPVVGANSRATGGSDWTTVARTTTTALTESSPHFEPQNAESIHVSEYATREAAPVGGDTAINPQPAMIAQSEGAEGTAVFETTIDERGTPIKCTITKSSTYAVLDVAVCKAAMKVHYTPRIVNGRPVQGVYRDAFTFRLSGNPGE